MRRVGGISAFERFVRALNTANLAELRNHHRNGDAQQQGAERDDDPAFNGDVLNDGHEVLEFKAAFVLLLRAIDCGARRRFQRRSGDDVIR